MCYSLGAINPKDMKPTCLAWPQYGDDGTLGGKQGDQRKVAGGIPTPRFRESQWVIIQKENREMSQSEQTFIVLCCTAASELKWRNKI